MNLLDLFEFVHYWAPLIFVLGTVMLLVGMGGVVAAHRSNAPVVQGRGARFTAGVARVGGPQPSPNDDLLDVARVTGVVQAGAE